MSEEEVEPRVPNGGGRKKMRANKTFDNYKFRSPEHFSRYIPIQNKRMRIEKRFDLSLHCFSFIQQELQNRGWEKFHSSIKYTNEYMARDFYTNASSKSKDVPEYESWVRGVSLKFSGDAINSALGLTAPPECWVEKMRAKPLSAETYGMLISSLCKPGAMWVSEKENDTPKFLRFRDLELRAKVWHCFYHASIEVCSTNYPRQLLVKNAFVVYALLNEKPINLGQLIADSITKIINEDLWLGHSSIINLLCETNGVCDEEYGDCFISPEVINQSWYDSEWRIDASSSRPLPNMQPKSPLPGVQPESPLPDVQPESFDFETNSFKFRHFQPQPTPEAPPRQNVQLFTMVDESTREHEFRMLQLCDMQTRHGSSGQLPNWMHNCHEWMGYLQNYHNRNKKRISREQFFDERYGIPPPNQMPPLSYFPPPYEQQDPQPPHQEGDQTSGSETGLGAAQESNFNHSSFAGPNQSPFFPYN